MATKQSTSSLNESDLKTRFKLGFILILKTFFELKTFYYASIIIGLILFTYSMTMANMLYKLNYYGMAKYYNYLSLVAFAPAFVFNCFILDDYLKSKSLFLLNKIINAILYAIYGGVIVLSAYFINHTLVMHIKLLCYINEVIFIAGFVSLLIKEINLNLNNKFILNKKLTT